MGEDMLRIGIILHSKRQDAMRYAARVAAYLEANAVEVCAEDEFAGDLGVTPFSRVDKADVIVSLGGDGTLLRGAQYAFRWEAELLEDVRYGTLLEGKETRQGRSGTWETSQWGSYTLCVYNSCPDAIRIETQEGSYVVNLASEGETRQLYQLIQDKMPASR